MPREYFGKLTEAVREEIRARNGKPVPRRKKFGNNRAALAAYLVNDNINWAIGLKLTQAAPDRFKAWAYRARCTAAVCQAVLIWMKWRALRRERAALPGGALRSEEQRALSNCDAVYDFIRRRHGGRR